MQLDKGDIEKWWCVQRCCDLGSCTEALQGLAVKLEFATTTAHTGCDTHERLMQHESVPQLWVSRSRRSVTIVTKRDGRTEKGIYRAYRNIIFSACKIFQTSLVFTLLTFSDIIFRQWKRQRRVDTCVCKTERPQTQIGRRVWDTTQTVFNGVDRLVYQCLREVKLQPQHTDLPTLYCISLDHIVVFYVMSHVKRTKI